MDMTEVNTITYGQFVSPEMTKLTHDMVTMIINNIGNDVKKKHGDLFCTEMKIYTYYYVINQVISYRLSYRSEVSCIGPRPKDVPIQLTKDL